MTFYLGLDLGQAADYTALCILEGPARPAKGVAVFHCRHLQRWPLRTSYPQIVEDVFKITTDARLFADLRDFDARLSRGELEENAGCWRHTYEPSLAIDQTGVGAPVVDLFKARFGRAGEQSNVRLRPVMITGGSEVTHENRVHKVPKRDLVSAAEVALQTGRLEIADRLKDAPTLVRELQSFRRNVNLETGHDSYGAWREGAHDDLVLAVCLALWMAENDRTRYVWWA